MNCPEPANGVFLSIGVIARNEADAIGPALESIFRQTVFADFAQRGRSVEICCLSNACTDATPQIAAAVFRAQSARHPQRHTFICRPVSLPQRGKLNAWNCFVHTLSAREARYLVLMDGDILLRHPATLRSLWQTLAAHPEAIVAVDEPVKDIALKPRPSLAERLSLATSRLTQGAAAQLSGQLYCIRAEFARNIHLPRALPACEDGFIKSIVATDFLLGRARPERIVRAPDASHIYEAYLSPAEILRNQKRQMIGQTFVHLLVDKCLPALTRAERFELGRTLRRLDAEFPSWLQRLMAEHLGAVRHCWRMFPGVLSFRWQRLRRMRGAGRLVHLPATLAGFLVTLAACWLAWRALRRGTCDFWPETRSRRLAGLRPAAASHGVGIPAVATPH